MKRLRQILALCLVWGLLIPAVSAVMGLDIAFRRHRSGRFRESVGG